MASLFGDPKNLPIECIHTHHQYPYAVRVVNKWIVQSGMPFDLKESSTEKSFRKYFGKNVRKLIYINQPPSFNPGYRCKFLKTARLHSLQIVKYPLRQIENLIITDGNSWMYQHYLKATPRKRRPGFGNITTYKRLKCIEGETGSVDMHLNPIRTLTNLQVLSVTLHEDMFAKNYRIFLSIKALKKLNLSIISIKTENPMTSQSEFLVFSDFLTDTTKLKNLDFLGLKLINIFDRIGPESRSRFFEALNKINIPAFSIELTDLDVYCPAFKILHTCTKNIDLLELDVEKDFSVSIVCGTDNITENTKRKLKMCFKFNNISLFPTSIQTQEQYLSKNRAIDSQISKPLDLTSKLEILANDCLGIPFCAPRGSNMKYLKRFSFNFARTLKTMSGEIDQVLLNIIQNQCNLEHLQLQRDTGSWSNKFNAYYCFSLISRTPAIQNLTSLHLTDLSVQENFFEILSEVFGHLKNIKTLRLDLQTKDPVDDNALLTIPDNSKLTHFYIKLPQLKESMISNFITMITSLHNLEELTLASGSQLIKADNNRFVLLEGFKELKKLRKVSILRSSSFLFGAKNDHRNPIVAKIISELKELYNDNSSLWKFRIESNEPPYQIRYKRY